MATRNWKHITDKIKTGDTICVFDTETTGLQSDAKIIQFYGMIYKVTEDMKLKALPISACEVLMNPEMPLPEKITEITGFTDAQLADKPKENEVADRIIGYMNYYGDKKPVTWWCAYNCSFDLKKLEGMAERTGIAKIADNNQDYMCLDPLAMAKERIPFILKRKLTSYKLMNVVKELLSDEEYAQLERMGFHNAGTDVRATAIVLEKMLQSYKTAATNKIVPVLEKACVFYNPYNSRQVRLKVKLAGMGQYGDIYWDVIQGCWASKSDKASKELFDSLHLPSLERQVIDKYGHWYDTRDMKTLAKLWAKDRKPA